MGLPASDKEKPKCSVNTTRTTHQKSRSTLPLLDCRPTTFEIFFLFMKFSCVVQSATVEIPAETKKKRGGSPPFFGRFYPTCDSAEYSGRELCCCRSRFAACPRPHHNPAHQIEKETGTHFSSHDFDDPKLETTLPPLEIVT